MGSWVPSGLISPTTLSYVLFALGLLFGYGLIEIHGGQNNVPSQHNKDWRSQALVPRPSDRSLSKTPIELSKDLLSPTRTNHLRHGVMASFRQVV